VTRHPSGLVIVTAAAPQMASVSLGLWMGVGGRYEPAEINGAAHFIEHMLFKGTRRRSALQISQAVEGVGGYLNAFTSEECTCFFSKALQDRLPELLEVMMDMLWNSRFAPADINLEREVIKEEIATGLDDPHQHVQELINQTLWPDHPLGRPLTGTPQTLERLGRKTLLRFMRQNYVASNAVLAAAGNLRHQAVVQAASRHLRALPLGPRPGFLPITCRQDRPRVNLFTKATAQAQVVLGVRTCARHDERRYPLRLLNTILGENMSSRLFQELREARGLVYHVQSSVSAFHDTGTLDISLGLDAENVPKALRIIIRELGRLRARPPGAAELRRARDYVLGQMALSLENTESQMNWLGEQWLGFGRIIPPAEVQRRLAAVTAQEIQATARDFFRPDRFSLAAVSPLRSGRGLERVLSSLRC
jgi:predicted Zn-dependent peptidase